MYSYFKTADAAYSAYLAQREITDKNYEHFKANIDPRSTEILESNHKRLKELADIYTVLRITEVNTAYANQSME